ncbi:MAG: HD domain-containing protein [Clostridia bacterium]|nr:HD domain-containing protein [Clostridia bacterium]
MNDYLLETKLRLENDDLHRRTKDSAFVLQKMLESFLPRFPNFTDHTMLHSMDVLEYSNMLIGEKQIERLSAAECYVLIMSCYLHDIGMGINQKNYETLSNKINFGNYFETHSRDDAMRVIRDFHNEYSGLIIRKYADLFDIPCEEMTFAIIHVSRGHRKTDLFDETEYRDLMTPYGIIRTAYLAAIIRLADEIDVGVDRNSELLFDSSKVTDRRDIEAFGTHESIRTVEVQDDAIVLITKPKAPEFRGLVEKLAGKIQETLDYCREVAAARSDFKITQTDVKIIEIE